MPMLGMLGVLAGFCWALPSIVWRSYQPSPPAWMILTTISGLLVLFCMGYAQQIHTMNMRGIAISFAIGAINICGGICYFKMLQTSGAEISRLAPIAYVATQLFIVCAGMVLYKEPIIATKLCGIVLAVAAIALLSMK